MFARQVAYSLSHVPKMKAVTSGKKTHPAIKRVFRVLAEARYRRSAGIA